MSQPARVPCSPNVPGGSGSLHRLVPSRPTICVAASSAPRASGETEGRRAYGARRRNLAHRYHVIRLLDGTRTYLHAVIDNFSRRILAWRVADTFAPVNSLAVLLDAGRRATGADRVPVVLADAGVENMNAEIDALIATGVLRRMLAFTELKFSNFMIEAWWRSLKHQWLFLHPLDSVATVRRLVAFYVDDHNRVLPHSAFLRADARRDVLRHPQHRAR